MAADTQLYLIVGGVAAIVIALLWRTVVRHGQLTGLQRRLCGADNPAERARAGNELIDLGLQRAAPVVLRAMPDEADDRVRESIALAVARRQWEPSGEARVGELRRWAAQQLDVTGEVTQFGPAVTRLADMGGPRPPRRAAEAPGAEPPTEPVIPSLVGADEDAQWTPRDDATA